MIVLFDLYQNEHKTLFINHYSRRGVEQWQLVGLITRRSQVRVLPPLLKGNRRPQGTLKLGSLAVFGLPLRGTSQESPTKEAFFHEPTTARLGSLESDPRLPAVPA